MRAARYAAKYGGSHSSLTVVCPVDINVEQPSKVSILQVTLVLSGQWERRICTNLAKRATALGYTSMHAPNGVAGPLI